MNIEADGRTSPKIQKDFLIRPLLDDLQIHLIGIFRQLNVRRAKGSIVEGESEGPVERVSW